MAESTKAIYINVPTEEDGNKIGYNLPRNQTNSLSNIYLLSDVIVIKLWSFYLEMNKLNPSFGIFKYEHADEMSKVHHHLFNCLFDQTISFILFDLR